MCVSLCACVLVVIMSLHAYVHAAGGHIAVYVCTGAGVIAIDASGGGGGHFIGCVHAGTGIIVIASHGVACITAYWCWGH